MCNMHIERIKTFVRRRNNARSLGVKFHRSATFTLPVEMIVAGRMIRLHLPDEHGVKMAFIDIFLDDCYRCHALKKSTGPVKTILDIGANAGLFGLHARNVFHDATIHAYEPNTLLLTSLSQHAASARFQYFVEAVGAGSGYVSLQCNGESVLTRVQPDLMGTVPQVSFQQAIERLGGNIDLLKIDCEGAEWELFEDTDSWRHVKHLCMEYHLFHPGQTEQAVRETLIDLGFTITSFVPIHNFGLVTATRHTSV